MRGDSKKPWKRVQSDIHTPVRSRAGKRHNKHSSMTATTTTALDVSKYFIALSQKEGGAVTNKKLQKLLYYAQAWSLALNDKKLFDDPIEAWVHGPAVREIYLRYKDLGPSAIKEDIDFASLRIPEEGQKILKEVWRVYGKYDCNYLELLTHSEQPWQQARAGLEPDEGSANVIDPDTMRDFYRAKLGPAK